MSLTYKALVVAAALAQLTSAFDRNDPLDGCPPAARTMIENQSVFNSTGETSFKLQGQSDDWHLALTFRDERAQNTLYSTSQTRQSLGVIVSVPESFPGSEAGKQTSLCVYRLEQQSAAANEQASCAGILSDACISALNSVPAASDGSCPVPDIAGACGDAAKVVGSTTTPLVFNSTLCSTNATIPHSDAIPDGYQNYITFASGELNRTDDSRTSFSVYNEHIVQPAPILITAKFGAGANATQSKLLCLAPSKVIQGSRTAVVTAAAGGGSSTAASLLGAAKPVLVISLLSSILAVAL
ncbi:hypothetical protein BBO_08173 [Beauveria brongniartii RCEF 3172]|uniref:Uncharacterized protein n=1 Tax=Beauveria brongniartii RCEF 3172 TaxID=1081107 RepID=A0A166Y727_9HYPO|nr:hypothetical protein BBO_08173 [Beauveria brongniartii RCEF 3172]